jgi:hypothetical protein
MQGDSCVDIAQNQTSRMAATRSFWICTPAAAKDMLWFLAERSLSKA